jgi:hypothetical protein
MQASARIRSAVSRVAACALLLLLPAAAHAQERPPRPDDVSAISVYQEVMPTSEGPRVVRDADSPTAPANRSNPGTAAPEPAASVPLAPSVTRELRRLPPQEAETLEEIATAPERGAPPAREVEPETRIALPRSNEQALGTSLTTVAQSERVLAVVGALSVATAMLLAALLFRRLRRPS